MVILLIQVVFEEFKTFNVNDGFAIVLDKTFRNQSRTIITDRESKIVEYRANELTIDIYTKIQR